MIKTLKFKSHLVELILSGEKTTTWRLFDDKDLQVGDEVELVNSDTKEVAARAQITHVLTKPLGQVTDADYAGHERYESQDDLLNHFRQYYGERVNLGTELKVVNFKLLTSELS